MKKLNLGCGSDIKKEYINLDIANLPGVNVVHDINKLPLPFKKEEFDYILCQDILEHIDYIPLLKELHRILKKDGIIEIRVPHFSSRFNYIDPTHKKQFSFQTFQFFIQNSEIHNRDYYFDFHFKKIIYTKITFEKGLIFYNYILEPIINSGEIFKRLYEATCLARIFPGANIIIKIKK